MSPTLQTRTVSRPIKIPCHFRDRGFQPHALELSGGGINLRCRYVISMQLLRMEFHSHEKSS